MKYSFYIVLVVLLFPFAAKAQDSTAILQEKFFGADSIHIVSHEERLQINNKTGEMTYKDFIVDGRPNYAIVKETVKLNKELSEQLYKILTAGKDKEYDTPYCFNPHHAILIYKDSVCSVIGFCFECMHWYVVGYHRFDVPVFHNEEVWSALCDFFRRQGIQYEMPEKR